MNHLLAVCSFLLGAVVGSFLNVVILRLPDPEQSIVFPASHCPRCSTPLHWYENIPILSYLFLRGRCRSCHQRIAIQYPLVELTMGLLALALWSLYGPSWAFAYYFVFSAGLLAIIFIDAALQIIPDVISLPGIILGLAGSFVIPQVQWHDSLLGILLGGGILYGIAQGYYLLTRQHGMGGGDIKLLAMIGAFLGYQCLLFVIFASSVTGTLFGLLAAFSQGKGGKTRIAFGPFLALAAFVWLFFHPVILRAWATYLALAAS